MVSAEGTRRGLVNSEREWVWFSLVPKLVLLRKALEGFQSILSLLPFAHNTHTHSMKAYYCQGRREESEHNCFKMYLTQFSITIDNVQYTEMNVQ